MWLVASRTPLRRTILSVRWAVRCSVLCCVAASCSVLQCVAACCSVLQYVALRCSVLQCVAVCCSIFCRYTFWHPTYLFYSTQILIRLPPAMPMGWLRLVGSLKWWVPFAKEPYKRDDILQKRPVILRSLLIVATPYLHSNIRPPIIRFWHPTNTFHPTHIQICMPSGMLSDMHAYIPYDVIYIYILWHPNMKSYMYILSDILIWIRICIYAYLPYDVLYIYILWHPNMNSYM